MANFKIAISKVLMHEGGYVNDPTDNGGETYRGISRKFHPGWVGWSLVDAAKKEDHFPNNLKANLVLHGLVMAFYKSKFWDMICGDSIKSQTIADLLVDTAVLEGISAGVKHAQGIVGMDQTGIVTRDLINKLNAL